MSHTPGPWKSSGQWIFGPKSMPLPVASGYQDYATMPGGQHYDEACANARLIAAAPDLLEALKYVMSAHGEQLHDAFDMAQKAIAKAEGSVMGRERA